MKIRKILEVALLVTAIGVWMWACLMITGCNAIHGIGEDLQEWTAPYAEPERN